MTQLTVASRLMLLVKKRALNLTIDLVLVFSLPFSIGTLNKEVSDDGERVTCTFFLSQWHSDSVSQSTRVHQQLLNYYPYWMFSFD